MAIFIPSTTPYELPYSVRFPKNQLLFSAHTDVTVQLKLPGGKQINEDILADAGSLLVVFFELAVSGALSGAQIPPWSSSIKDFDESVEEDTISWTLRDCCLSESSLVMLAQSFLLVYERFPFESLTFLSDKQESGYTQLATNISMPHSVYPDVYKPLEFNLTNDFGSSSGAEIVIEFENELTDEDKVNLDVELTSWFAAGEVGFYAVSPLSPADSTFTSNDDLFFDVSTLEFSLSRFRADPAALNGLVNICSAMSHNIATIKEVVID
jgi:hypothetical protein